MTAAIYGISGPALTEWERGFLAEHRPWGVILFARNIETPDQVGRLTGDLGRVLDRARVAILIDQEGGRVARLKPPHWRPAPPAAAFGALYAHDPAQAVELCRLNSRLLAAELGDLGITVDCLPVLDIPAAGADPIIGDRAYGTAPDAVVALGRAAATGLLEGGVLPVIKHVPGHGRAQADSHLALPEIDAAPDDLAATDFVPFRALSDCPLAMTAHIVLKRFDPDAPVTLSRPVIERVIRAPAPQGLGYDGVLMTDDLSMKALEGPMAERTRRALAAGCDLVLHCNGVRAEMEQIAGAVPLLDGAAADRVARAEAHWRTAGAFDPAAARARIDRFWQAGV